MNKNQKRLVIKWAIGYALIAIMFAAMYFFEDPMPIVLAIMVIMALFGGKKYQYDRERAEREMQEFIEYSKKHKFILTTIAVYSVLLPILLFVLSKKNYINIGTDSKSFTKFGLLTVFPFFLFDIGHRVYIYNKNEGLTEHGNQPDTD
jgi:hypothetical protein